MEGYTDWWMSGWVGGKINILSVREENTTCNHLLVILFNTNDSTFSSFKKICPQGNLMYEITLFGVLSICTYIESIAFRKF